MFELLFAILHFLLFIGAIGYAFYTLITGNPLRFGVMIAGLTAYYFFVLHKAVRKEIKRKRDQRGSR